MVSGSTNIPTHECKGTRFKNIMAKNATLQAKVLGFKIITIQATVKNKKTIVLIF